MEAAVMVHEVDHQAKPLRTDTMQTIISGIIDINTAHPRVEDLITVALPRLATEYGVTYRKLVAPVAIQTIISGIIDINTAHPKVEDLITVALPRLATEYGVTYRKLAAP